MRKPKPDHEEQYAFRDFLQKRLSREWALYEWTRKKSKPIDTSQKDDEPRIDVQHPTYDEWQGGIKNERQ